MAGPDDSSVLVKAKGAMDGVEMDRVFECIYDVSRRKRWDTVLIDLDVIERVSDTVDFFYFRVKVL